MISNFNLSDQSPCERLSRLDMRKQWVSRKMDFIYPTKCKSTKSTNYTGPLKEVKWTKLNLDRIWSHGGGQECSSFQLLCWMFVCMSVLAFFLQTLSHLRTVISACSRQELINIGLRSKIAITINFQRHNNIPEDIAKPEGDPWIYCPAKRQRRQRQCKLGCCLGIQARLRKNAHKPPLPSILMTNMKFIIHKMDELKLLTALNQFVQNHLIIITESWLHPLIPNAAIQLAGRISHQ